MSNEVLELADRMAGLASKLESDLKRLDALLGGDTVPTAELELGVITTDELIPGDRFDWHGHTFTAITHPADYRSEACPSEGVVWLRVAELPGRLFLPSGMRVSMVSAAPYMPEAEAAYENEVQP